MVQLPAVKLKVSKFNNILMQDDEPIHHPLLPILFVGVSESTDHTHLSSHYYLVSTLLIHDLVHLLESIELSNIYKAVI